MRTTKSSLWRSCSVLAAPGSLLIGMVYVETAGKTRTSADIVAISTTRAWTDSFAMVLLIEHFFALHCCIVSMW